MKTAPDGDTTGYRIRFWGASHFAAGLEIRPLEPEEALKCRGQTAIQHVDPLHELTIEREERAIGLTGAGGL